MADMLERSLGPSLIIETRFPLNLPCRPLFADPNQLEMALLNLMVNARDAMPRGGPIIISAQAATIDKSHTTLVPPVIDSAVDFRIDGSAMTEMHRRPRNRLP